LRYVVDFHISGCTQTSLLINVHRQLSAALNVIDKLTIPGTDIQDRIGFPNVSLKEMLTKYAPEDCSFCGHVVESDSI